MGYRPAVPDLPQLISGWVVFQSTFFLREGQLRLFFGKDSYDMYALPPLVVAIL